MKSESLYLARFFHNFLYGIIFIEILTLIFGTVNPQFGLRFGPLYCLIMTPYILYLYGEEKKFYIKKYGWKEGRRAPLRLVFARYLTGLIAFSAATVEKHFGENIPLLLLLGFLWTVMYAKALADAYRPEVPHPWAMKLVNRSTES
ncbi:hypothetical protein PNA2_0209 [Pyrococcus sp. NA2]|uniref:hypothetical protein n=1 Tax=Pyrococcus sp. (strain NA2) TaxID=342949 RepID=UPI000209AF52|nr:hypothetical protein [Pyrococcus sp. NA2]AEC51127.1 hypothetical protein PNA2_0209 [Pyrococcus sp. NA2]